MRYDIVKQFPCAVGINDINTLINSNILQAVTINRHEHPHYHGASVKNYDIRHRHGA